MNIQRWGNVKTSKRNVQSVMGACAGKRGKDVEFRRKGGEEGKKKGRSSIGCELRTRASKNERPKLETGGGKKKMRKRTDQPNLSS